MPPRPRGTVKHGACEHPRDPVTPALRRSVLKRDGGCVAAAITDDLCHDQWGTVIPWNALDRMTLDHVQSGGGRMGKRAPSDADHLVTLCPHHHLNGWATSHRPTLRAYLAHVVGARSGSTEPNADIA